MGLVFYSLPELHRMPSDRNCYASASHPMPCCVVLCRPYPSCSFTSRHPTRSIRLQHKRIATQTRCDTDRLHPVAELTDGTRIDQPSTINGEPLPVNAVKRLAPDFPCRLRRAKTHPHDPVQTRPPVSPGSTSRGYRVENATYWEMRCESLAQ